ncbi:hypothetical protein SAMN02910298_01796 [Pseudobutyrivibrio sp. YE44]|uniref:hypothetical protein n=1 Tax=Pseudobutyrivibrio sp. YE44 TaxID=1520802 RepID=UPI00088CF5E6|nr:hypothetical protein [Pseudobutyrivibrio sp. YE44]SDB37198.1 hypothetical protein SAMN02910298_01796 [Pseudobutyrivibrio sp. YE44]
MKNLEVALCDFDSDYIIMFANHVMSQPKVSVHIFTTPEGFFSDENDFDVTILTEDFEEISGFRPKGSVGHKYILCEESENLTENQIYKYQSVDKIVDEIKELREIGIAKASIKKSNVNSKLVGVYSPTSHELQLPFAMALGQAYRTGGRVLFIDLEELSVMPNLIGNGSRRNLMDLLYDINTSENVDLSQYLRTFMGFDYIEPFLNPNEIGEIDAETWNKFFEMLAKSSYDVVVVLFGRAINGFTNHLQQLNKLYVLGRSGDYFRKGQELFLDYLSRIEAEVEVEDVTLPMSAGNLMDGTYQIEELLQGNLGVFVRKLTEAKNNKSSEAYG